MTLADATVPRRSWRDGLRGALFPTLRGYRRPWLRADLVAGVAAGSVVIPQAMAYATIADMPVHVGLYTCMVPMAIYAVLGGSRPMSVSTSSTVALLCATTLAGAGLHTGTTAAIPDLSTLVFLVGVILLLFRLLNLGGLIDNISEAVLVGVKAGVGLTVAAKQLPALLGIPDADASGFFREIWADVRHLGDANGATVALGLGTIAVLIALRRLVPRAPGPLVAVAGGIVLVALFDLDQHGVALIAKVPSGLPLPQAPAFDKVGALLPGAIAIALMVFLESVSVARVMATRDDPVIDNDQELTAMSAASLAGAFFQALPAAGGFSQSAINQSSGAKTQLSELTTVLLAVLVALFLAPVLDDLPQATLAAIVIVATLGLISIKEFARFARIEPVELWLAVITAVVGLTSGLLAAVTVGVVLTLVGVLLELNRAPLYELDTGGREGLLALRVGTPVYTANARGVQRRVLRRAAAAGRPVDVVVLDATSMCIVSVTVLDALSELSDQLEDRGAELWIASLDPEVLAVARRTTWWPGWEAAGRVHPDAAAAIAAYRGPGADAG